MRELLTLVLIFIESRCVTHFLSVTINSLWKGTISILYEIEMIILEKTLYVHITLKDYPLQNIKRAYSTIRTIKIRKDNKLITKQLYHKALVLKALNLKQ